MKNQRGDIGMGALIALVVVASMVGVLILMFGLATPTAPGYCLRIIEVSNGNATVQRREHPER